MANDVCRPPIEQIPSFNAIPPLNAWGFQNVVPFTFGDDISEYEMVCKLRWYVKTLIDAVNQINEDLCNIHGTINDVINKVNQIGTSLETVNNNLAALEQRLAANETAVDNLNTELGKTNTKVAENTAAIQSNLNLIQKNIADIATLVEKVTQLRTDVDNHTEQIANINTHIATIDSQITEINGHLTTIDGEINALQEKAATHDTQIGELTTRANQNDADHAQFKSDITALQEADNQLNTKLERVAAKANDNASDITSMKQVDASHTAAIQTINDNVATINTILDNHKDRLDGLDDRVVTISNQADSNASNIANLEIEQVDQNNRIKAVEDKVKDLPPSFEDLTAQVETNKTDISNLKTITDGHTESITEINANRANDKAEIDANTQAIQTLENSDNVMEQRMNTFETTVTAVETKVDNVPADVGTELETINNNITAVTETANTASTTATEAKTVANSANTLATEAKTKAEEAYTEAMHATGDIAELTTTVGSNTAAITVIEQEQTAQNDRIKALEDAGGSVPADVQEQIDALKVVNQRQDTDISNLTSSNSTLTTNMQTLNAKQETTESDLNHVKDALYANSTSITVPTAGQIFNLMTMIESIQSEQTVQNRRIDALESGTGTPPSYSENYGADLPVQTGVIGYYDYRNATKSAWHNSYSKNYIMQLNSPDNFGISSDFILFKNDSRARIDTLQDQAKDIATLYFAFELVNSGADIETSFYQEIFRFTSLPIGTNNLPLTFSYVKESDKATLAVIESTSPTKFLYQIPESNKEFTTFIIAFKYIPQPTTSSSFGELKLFVYNDLAHTFNISNGANHKMTTNETILFSDSVYRYGNNYKFPIALKAVIFGEEPHTDEQIIQNLTWLNEYYNGYVNLASLSEVEQSAENNSEVVDTDITE